MTGWQWQGKHRFNCDGDIVIFELHGLFNVEDAHCIFRLADAQDAKYGYVLFLFDARDGINMSPQARRKVADKSRVQPAQSATAIVGASVAMRTVALLIQNAGRLFGFQINKMEFCATMEEGVAWLGDKRQQFITRSHRPGPPAAI